AEEPTEMADEDVVSTEEAKEESQVESVVVAKAEEIPAEASTEVEAEREEAKEDQPTEPVKDEADAEQPAVEQPQVDQEAAIQPEDEGVSVDDSKPAEEAKKEVESPSNPTKGDQPSTEAAIKEEATPERAAEEIASTEVFKKENPSEPVAEPRTEVTPADASAQVETTEDQSTQEPNKPTPATTAVPLSITKSDSGIALDHKSEKESPVTQVSSMTKDLGLSVSEPGPSSPPAVATSSVVSPGRSISLNNDSQEFYDAQSTTEDNHTEKRDSPNSPVAAAAGPQSEITTAIASPQVRSSKDLNVETNNTTGNEGQKASPDSPTHRRPRRASIVQKLKSIKNWFSNH
ncbi:hypothetical protein H4219_004044, partial [Mycoemilia scoparia]